MICCPTSYGLITVQVKDNTDVTTGTERWVTMYVMVENGEHRNTLENGEYKNALEIGTNEVLVKLWR